MICEVSEKELEKARREYQFFLVGKTGSFTAHLFQAIASADIWNKRRLARVYGAHVYAYLEYTGELNLIDFEFCD